MWPWLDQTGPKLCLVADPPRGHTTCSGFRHVSPAMKTAWKNSGQPSLPFSPAVALLLIDTSYAWPTLRDTVHLECPAGPGLTVPSPGLTPSESSGRACMLHPILSSPDAQVSSPWGTASLYFCVSQLSGWERCVGREVLGFPWYVVHMRRF